MGYVCLDDSFVPSVAGQSQDLTKLMGHMWEPVAACCVSACGWGRTETWFGTSCHECVGEPWTSLSCSRYLCMSSNSSFWYLISFYLPPTPVWSQSQKGLQNSSQWELIWRGLIIFLVEKQFIANQIPSARWTKLMFILFFRGSEQLPGTLMRFNGHLRQG